MLVKTFENWMSIAKYHRAPLFVAPWPAAQALAPIPLPPSLVLKRGQEEDASISLSQPKLHPPILRVDVLP